MDFLDPQKQKAHRIRLALGYTLIGLTLVMATIILLYRAYGFGLDSHGRVIQSGLIFISSQPSGADIYTNGRLQDSQTDSRLVVPAGQYTFELKRSGYHSWKRAITSEGGSVQRFDYPFLFPVNLKTTPVKSYTAQPSLVSQSPNGRWMLVEPAGSQDLDLFDLRGDTPKVTPLAVPPEVLSAGSVTTTWQEVEWSKDNRHVLLRRIYQKDGQPGSEYIMVDRQNPLQSVNLSITLGFTPANLVLRDGVYDSYYAYDQNNQALFTATLERPTPQLLQADVLAFKASGEDMVVYVTAKDAPAGKVLVRVRDGDRTYTLRQLMSGSSYLLEAARYADAWYVAAGAALENKVYVYKEPVARLQKDPKQVQVPVHILKVVNPTFISFSPANRLLMIENSDSFAVYDALTAKGYAYQLKLPLDAGVAHATWMDGYHLSVFSGSQVVIFDFDGANRQTLITTNPMAGPFFKDDYTAMYTLSIPQANGAVSLQSTALRTPEDL